MRAVVLEEPGPVDHLKLKTLPVPEAEPGWVRIKVEAFGLNRSELHTRLGLAEGVTFPRVLGIEATGTIDADPDGVLAPGQQVMTMVGGMGRTFDGGYAEYTVVPRSQVIPFTSRLPWETLGALPETLQTAYGSLTTGLALSAGQSLLIRGGTSALGLATAALARDIGATVAATTRNPDRVRVLADHGVDHPLVDNGEVAPLVREIYPEGVDAGLELVGTPTLPDTLAATRDQGTVCFTGMLSNQWTVRDFYPIEYLPRGVRLSAYGGATAELPPEVLQHYLDRIATGEFSAGPVHVYPLDRIRDAHRDMEEGAHTGKLVVRL
ncbi:zinc-binding dehydrogenase [Streptomyces tsukubensis]|uniref:NADPH:quinone reductase n=2 Tax=Streptomyces TaxID=1883 RepID=A0A7G3UQN9_STRT9|nr:MULTISPECIES: zinc-binding dehydrogenase [Streptomyces]AZK98704.1 NADPH:quinone reductase [Streptomyces tsukubensis]MYS68270.1 zinc-binding dehydrogenase [Streptomyces sp. SID5473]QKM71380.1 NADPH:quinone reductase [Streptomyces tsukubensis NRRL18488]TAI45533.1 NADPH:quinone reductase [Streptomyces tsukubensis]